MHHRCQLALFWRNGPFIDAKSLAFSHFFPPTDSCVQILCFFTKSCLLLAFSFAQKLAVFFFKAPTYKLAQKLNCLEVMNNH